MGTMIWLVLFVLLLIIEIITMGLTTIWFAGGAVIALVLAYFKVHVAVQVIAFLLVSIVLLVLTRPIAIKYFNQEREKTNVDSLHGQKAVVIESIDTLRGIGRVEVNGMEWAAKMEGEKNTAEIGEVVTIKGIQGVKLVVDKEEVL